LGLRRRRFNSALTLLELLTVITIIAILAVMMFPAVGAMRSRAEKVKCVANLRNLHIATNTFIQQNGHWPQISASLIATANKEYARQWVEALQPFGLQEENWICPTVQRLGGNPNFKEPDKRRIDYLSTPFDAKEFTPFKWPTQPWFVERADVHGDGQLVIFPDGSVRSLGDFARKQRSEGVNPQGSPKKKSESVVVSINATTPSASEAGQKGLFTVSRTGETTRDLKVKLNITGTATNGDDYTTIPDEIDIPAGSTTAVIEVSPLQDSIAEGTETVIVTIRAQPGLYKVGASYYATVTIQDASPAKPSP
jgi:type II secretory pathway pseudopilin PulG